jgi:hypothetical protein
MSTIIPPLLSRLACLFPCVLSCPQASQHLTSPDHWPHNFLSIDLLSFKLIILAVKSLILVMIFSLSFVEYLCCVVENHACLPRYFLLNSGQRLGVLTVVDSFCVVHSIGQWMTMSPLKPFQNRHKCCCGLPVYLEWGLVHRRYCFFTRASRAAS